jgi:hypothetical protein
LFFGIAAVCVCASKGVVEIDELALAMHDFEERMEAQRDWEWEQQEQQEKHDGESCLDGQDRRLSRSLPAFSPLTPAVMSPLLDAMGMVLEMRQMLLADR